MKKRLDKYLVEAGKVATRSQAESYIRLGKVKINGRTITKPGHFVGSGKVTLEADTQYVSRAAMKLESVAEKFGLNFKDKTVLDVGSSTGGFTDFALHRGAKKCIAVDVGSDQLHPKLRQDTRVDLREKTDIRDFVKTHNRKDIDIVLIDVSFISILEVLKVLPKAIRTDTEVIAMVKPQFEVQDLRKMNKGVIKNESLRREILSRFERRVKAGYAVKDKADSSVKGEKGNRERFYKLFLLKDRPADNLLSR